MIEAIIAILVFGGTMAAIDNGQNNIRRSDLMLHEQTKEYMLTKRAHCEQLKYGVKACWKVERFK